MAYLDNPAGRLLHWLQDVAGAYGNKGDALSEAWSAMIQADRSSADGRARLFHHASLLADQCVEVRSEAKALPDHSDSHLLLEYFDQVEAAVGFFTNMDQVTLDLQLKQIEATGFHSLKMLDSALHRYRSQGTVPEQTLRDLIESVDRLLENLNVVADMDYDVRDFVRVRFTQVQTALNDCGVKGPRDVETVTDAILNNYHREPAMWRRTMESSLGTVVGGVLLQLVFNLTGMAPTAKALPPGTPEPVIDQTVRIYIEHSGSQAEPVQGETGDGIVDAEIVDDEQDGSAAPSNHP